VDAALGYTGGHLDVAVVVHTYQGDQKSWNINPPKYGKIIGTSPINGGL
jgi:hypothetical protein